MTRLLEAAPVLTRVAPTYELRELTNEEHEQYAEMNYVAYEPYPEPGEPVVGRFWTRAQLDGDIYTLSFECPFHLDCTRIEIPTTPTNGPLGWGRSSLDLVTITIHPSILRTAEGCRWHGVISQGIFSHIGDSQ